jgi:cell division protein FtsW
MGVESEDGGRSSGSEAPVSLRVQAERLRSAITWLVALLGGFGLVMIFAATYFTSSASGGTPWGPVTHQALWLAIGALVFVGASRVRPSQLRALTPALVVVVLALLAAVLIPGVGATVNGSSRWFVFGPIQIQVSEVAKFVLILHLSRLLSRTHPSDGFRKRTLPALVIIGLFALFVLIEPDMGTAALLGICGFGLLVASGTSVRELVGTAVCGGIAGYYFAFSQSYRRERMLSFLHPWLHRSNWSYQVVQSLAAFATGHLTGVGLGAGQSSYNYLPNAQTDFIFSVVGQDLGFVGALALLAALFALVFMVLKSARVLSRPMDSLFALGVAAWIGGQIILNVAAVEGLAPVTGVPLPLVSAGGSSTVIILLALGLVRGALRASNDGDRPAEIEAPVLARPRGPFSASSRQSWSTMQGRRRPAPRVRRAATSPPQSVVDSPKRNPARQRTRVPSSQSQRIAPSFNESKSGEAVRRRSSSDLSRRSPSQGGRLEKPSRAARGETVGTQRARLR